MFSLADAILQENPNAIHRALSQGESVNELDEYGFTPLIEAAIVDNQEITALLLDNGADPNKQDVTGGTPLQWAVENNSLSLAKLLIDHGANPNAYNFSGQPVLVMPILRQQMALKKYLLEAGADQLFAQDYINTKLTGHLFELVGTAHIISPSNDFVEVDFEGFILEVTLGLISDSLAQFQNHFAARQLRRFSGISQFIVKVMQNSLHLLKYQQYRVDITQHQSTIQQLLSQDPLIIPVGYEGHAITFIRYGDIWVKCDRREDSRLYDNIMFYRIRAPEMLTEKFFKYMLYEKQSSEFINESLDQLLQLEPLTELKVESQISGNCSWANVEATIPALFFLILMQMNKEPENLSHYKTLALNYFHRWRSWNMSRVLQFCMQRYQEGDLLRKASQAEMLAAILFQRIAIQQSIDHERMDMVVSLLLNSPYEYILRNYLRVYYYKKATEEGKRFFDYLKGKGLKP